MQHHEKQSMTRTTLSGGCCLSGVVEERAFCERLLEPDEQMSGEGKKGKKDKKGHDRAVFPPHCDV